MLRSCVTDSPFFASWMGMAGAAAAVWASYLGAPRGKACGSAKVSLESDGGGEVEAWSSLRRFRAANAECFGFEVDALDFGSCCQERRGEQTSDDRGHCGQTLCSASQFEDGAAAFFCFSMLSCAVREVDGGKGQGEGRRRGRERTRSANKSGPPAGHRAGVPQGRLQYTDPRSPASALLHVLHELWSNDWECRRPTY